MPSENSETKHTIFDKNELEKFGEEDMNTRLDFQEMIPGRGWMEDTFIIENLTIDASAAAENKYVVRYDSITLASGDSTHIPDIEAFFRSKLYIYLWRKNIKSAGGSIRFGDNWNVFQDLPIGISVEKNSDAQ